VKIGPSVEGVFTDFSCFSLNAGLQSVEVAVHAQSSGVVGRFVSAGRRPAAVGGRDRSPAPLCRRDDHAQDDVCAMAFAFVSLVDQVNRRMCVA
jgi:hypothetical protein